MLCKGKKRGKARRANHKNVSPCVSERNKPEICILRHKQPKAQFFTDPEVTKIRSVKVQSPNTWRGKDR